MTETTVTAIQNLKMCPGEVMVCIIFTGSSISESQHQKMKAVFGHCLTVFQVVDTTIEDFILTNNMVSLFSSAF